MSSSAIRTLAWVLVLHSAAAATEAQQTVRLPGRDVALKDRPADVYSVGTVEGENWEMFSSIRSVAFDRSDNMYLLDGQNYRVVVFDARGRFVRQFGKQGGGPGEFRAPLAMDITADGKIVVSDLGNRGFILFEPTGEYIRNVAFSDDLGMPMGLAADPRGNVIVRSMPRILPGQSPDDARFSTIHRQSLAATEEKPQSLFRVAVNPPKITDTGAASGTRRVMSVSIDPVFGPRPAFAPLANGLAVHHETTYDIHILDADGRAVRKLSREYTPKKVTKKDQEEWQERSRNQQGGAGMTIVASTSGGGAPGSFAGTGGGNVRIGGGGAPSSAQTLSMGPGDVPFAEYMAVVTSIRSDPQGRIWVQRRNNDNTNAGPIDLLTAEGRYIGTLPAQAMPNAVSASGLAAWVITDDLGVERVAVRRLPASWR